MSAFEYNALDAEGRERSGVLEGDTARQVRQALRERGLTPLEVEELSRPRKGQGTRRPRSVRRVSPAQLALITRQLATLLRAALPLEEALQAAAQQSERAHLSSLLLGVRARVMEGYSLADGLDAYPHVFPPLYRATVAAGEQTGRLDVVLERLADYTENRQEMRQKVQMALIYPVILTLVAIGVVVLLLAYVVPEVVQVFENIGQGLPWLTRALIATSDLLRAYGLWLLGAMVIGVIAARSVLRRERPRRRYHQWLLRVPLLGRLIQGLNAARFARTLSILMASGVPVLEALRIASEVVSNLAMREAAEQAMLRVREGASLHNALLAGGRFPPMLLHLIGSGEQSGNLEGMLERAADNQDREVQTITGMTLSLFEPLLILVMAGIVLVIVLAVLLPIFELNQLVR